MVGAIAFSGPGMLPSALPQGVTQPACGPSAPGAAPLPRGPQRAGMPGKGLPCLPGPSPCRLPSLLPTCPPPGAATPDHLNAICPFQQICSSSQMIGPLCPCGGCIVAKHHETKPRLERTKPFHMLPIMLLDSKMPSNLFSPCLKFNKEHSQTMFSMLAAHTGQQVSHH